MNQTSNINESNETFEMSVKKYTLFCSTHLDCKNDDCTICRKSLDEDSIFAQEENYCSTLVSNSICNHTFHKECIEPWLRKFNKCPICASQWK